MIQGKVTIPRAWRSQFGRLIALAVSSVACILLSHYYPNSIITGKLFDIGQTRVFLTLPLFTLAPLYILCDLLLKIYDVRYIIDARGIEARVGILSMRQSITRIRFEDIRSVETDQSLVQRLLNVGTVDVATAAVAGIEITMEGISAPHQVREIILTEREEREKKAKLDAQTPQKLSA